VFGNEEFIVSYVERAPERLGDAPVERDAPDECGPAVDLFAPRDVTLEIARNRRAETLQHLPRLVPLLLGMDHVRLRENAAASSDLRCSIGRENYIAHILDVEPEAARLLIHE
jgi:hypothetical protein